MLEIRERRQVRIRTAHPDAEFGRVHAVRISYEVIRRTPEDLAGTVIATRTTRKAADAFLARAAIARASGK